MIVNKYANGGGSGSGVTPEQVQQQIDSALTPYWDSAITESAITEAVSGLATEQYVQDALSGVSLEGYWTSAETKTYVDSAVTDTQNQLNEISGMMQSKELVISTAFNQLSDEIDELSGRSVDLSAYYTSAQTDAAIAQAVSGLATEQYVQDALSGVNMDNYYTSAQTKDAISAATSGKADAANVTANTSMIFPKWNAQGIITGTTGNNLKRTGFYLNGTVRYLIKEAASGDLGDLYGPTTPGTAGQILVSAGNGAPVWTTDNKVSSTSVSTIWKGTQAEYDAIPTKDPNTFYIIVNN